MMTETLLASLHLLALLAVIVFQTSQTALCRAEWVNAAVVRRMVALDNLFLASAAALLLSGVARLLWGIKGMQWYVGQPLFHLKMTLLCIMVVLAVRGSLTIRRWCRTLDAAGTLPDATALQGVRRLLMWQMHIMPVAVVVAVFWTRGW